MTYFNLFTWSVGYKNTSTINAIFCIMTDNHSNRRVGSSFTQPSSRDLLVELQVQEIP
ncbi:MAG: hypothetical protein V4489_05335 [Chlamydiota bacterium]